MNFRKMLIGAAAVLSLAACSKSNDGKVGAASVSAPALEDANRNTGAYAAGVPNFLFQVESGVLAVDGVTISKIDDSTFAGFPMLARQVAELASVNRVIETKENTLELWASDALLLAFDIRSGAPSILHSRSGSFTIENARWTLESSEEGKGKGMNHAVLNIDMRECASSQKQDQGKEQEKQSQEQGKKSLLADTFGEGQSQEQEKRQEKPAEMCKLVSFTYHLAELAHPKEQEQSKEQNKEQNKEQGKSVEPGQTEEKK